VLTDPAYRREVWVTHLWMLRLLLFITPPESAECPRGADCFHYCGVVYTYLASNVSKQAAR